MSHPDQTILYSNINNNDTRSTFILFLHFKISNLTFSPMSIHECNNNWIKPVCVAGTDEIVRVKTCAPRCYCSVT